MKMEPSRPADLLSQAADTFRARAKVYGMNYLRVGNVMAALFPEGVTLKTPEDHVRFELLEAQVIKLCRYANNWNKGGHFDSSIDDAVYGVMLAAVDEAIAKTEVANVQNKKRR